MLAHTLKAFFALIFVSLIFVSFEGYHTQLEAFVSVDEIALVMRLSCDVHLLACSGT
ncbi:MAG: hypothetical protein Q4G54_03385 [Pelistega sp.]|nr:hypothetical protein [Pelistega sp.]